MGKGFCNGSKHTTSPEGLDAYRENRRTLSVWYLYGKALYPGAIVIGATFTKDSDMVTNIIGLLLNYQG